MHRRWLAALAVLMIICVLAPMQALAATPADWSADHPESLEAGHLYGTNVVLVDYDTGEILFIKDGRVRVHPASTTKIMTLLLALESGIDLDTVITIPLAANDIPKSSSLVPVRPGEQMTFRDLLYGTMLASGNDGANSIAALVAGSVEKFVDIMNARAAELGCEGTHFNNAHGYTDNQHYSTALDLARITMAAMQNQTFRDIVSSASYVMNISGRGAVKVLNRAVILDPASAYYYEDCIGVKTGFTNAAGQCFVGAAKLDDRVVISVVMGTDPTNENLKWQDTKRLFEYARTRYERYNLTALLNMVPKLSSVPVANARSDDAGGGLLSLRLAQLSNAEYSCLALPGNQTDMSRMLNNFVSRTTIEYTRDFEAPLMEGEILGNFTYLTEEGEEITGFLVAGRTVEREPEKLTLTALFPFLKNLEGENTRTWIIAILAVIALIVLVRVIRNTRRNRRRRRIYRSRVMADQRRRR